MRLKCLVGMVTILVCAAWAQAMTIDEEIAAAGESEQARKALEARALAMLKGYDWEAKDRACRYLRVVGTAESVEALAGLLEDEKLSHMARYALEQMECAEASKALRDAAGRTSGMTKVGIVHSIGVRRDEEALGLLTGLLGDGDADVAGAAVWAMGQMGTPEAAKALTRFEKNAPAELQSALLDGLLAVADGLVGRGESGDAYAIYRRLSEGAKDNHVRMSAVAGLLQCQPDKAADRLSALMRDRDSQMRSFAVASVVGLKDAGAGARFAAELPKLPADMQVLLIDALARRNEPAVRDAITAAAASEDEGVRTAAAKALGDIGDASSVPVLAKLVAGSGADSQAAAASLRRLKGDGVAAMIFKVIQTTSQTPVIVEMIEVLNDRDVADGAGAILWLARSEDESVRTAALRATANLAGPKWLRELIEFLAGLEGDAGRKEAERAVVSVSLKIEEENKRAAAAIKALTSAKDTVTRCSLLRVLGGIATKYAFVEVVDAVKDEDAAVKDAAVRVLGEWSDPEAAGQLVELYAAADNAVHRTLLLRGCARLLSMGKWGADRTVAACGELMKGVKTPQERKLVLAVLANVGAPAAAEMVAPLMDDNAVKAEAEVAMLGIAKAMVGKHPQQAKVAARTLIKKTTNDTIRRQARGVIRQIEGGRGG